MGGRGRGEARGGEAGAILLPTRDGLFFSGDLQKDVLHTASIAAGNHGIPVSVAGHCYE